MVSPFQRVEIEINTVCDMKCFACDRFVPTHPSPSMTLDQIRRFVVESLALSWDWKRIHVLGGEPSLHPEFKRIIETLLPLKYPGTVLRVISNGKGKIEDFREWLESIDVELNIETKSSDQDPAWFSNMLCAPCDTEPGLKSPCSIYGTGERGCGLGLTRHGFFLCGAGASIARVTGQVIGVMSLIECTDSIFRKQAETICNLCGHWNPNGFSTRPNSIENVGTEPGKFWSEQLALDEKYNLPLYGEQL